MDISNERQEGHQVGTDEKAGELMTQSYVFVHLGDAADEVRQLVEEVDYAVVMDADDNIVSLISAEDVGSNIQIIESGTGSSTEGLPPVIVIPSHITVPILIEIPASASLDWGARGAVIVEEGGVVGILPKDVLARYRHRDSWDREQWQLLKSSGDIAVTRDTQLHGDPPAVLVTCTTCKYQNSYDYLYPGVPCQRPNFPIHPVTY